MQPFLHGGAQARPSPAQFPPDQVDQHHHEHMTAGVLRRAHLNGAGFQVRGFAGAEGLLDFRQVLVAVMHYLLRSGVLGQVRLDHVTPVQPRGFLLGRFIHPQLQAARFAPHLQPKLNFQFWCAVDVHVSSEVYLINMLPLSRRAFLRSTAATTVSGMVAGSTRRMLAAVPGKMASSTPFFSDVAQQVGLDFVHFNGMSGELYYPEMLSTGVALFDYDNDGDLDIFLVQGQMLGPGKTLDQAIFPPKGPLPLRGRLYRNDYSN